MKKVNGNEALNQILFINFIYVHLYSIIPPGYSLQIYLKLYAYIRSADFKTWLSDREATTLQQHRSYSFMELIPNIPQSTSQTD